MRGTSRRPVGQGLSRLGIHHRRARTADRRVHGRQAAGATGLCRYAKSRRTGAARSACRKPSASEPLPDAPQLASVPVITRAHPRTSGPRARRSHFYPRKASRDPAATPSTGSSRRNVPRTTQSSGIETAARNASASIHRRRSLQRRSRKEFEWDPEPDQVGLAEGFIPYVRIGQRCVVGLGFFGCNLSKLPEANSHLFDGMHDPDRQRSSVPDVDTSSALDPPPD